MSFCSSSVSSRRTLAGDPSTNEPGGIFGGKPSPIPLPFPVTPPGAGPAFDEALYQTVMAVDPTRPISTDFTGSTIVYRKEELRGLGGTAMPSSRAG